MRVNYYKYKMMSSLNVETKKYLTKIGWSLLLWVILISVSTEQGILPSLETNNQYQKYYRDLVAAQNSRLIQNFNNDQAHSFKLKRNNFISMRNQQFRTLYTMKIKTQETLTVQNPKKKSKCKLSKKDTKQTKLAETKIIYEPAKCSSVNVDWTIHASPVKDQGLCNSCYAHSIIATIETRLFADYGIRYDLSEQQITECSLSWVPQGYELLNNKGCQGGWGWKALAYVQFNGVTLEQNYPYTAGKDKILKTCNETLILGKRFKVDGFEKFYEPNEPQTQCKILNEKLRQGNTIAVSIWVPEGFQFQFYGSQTPSVDIFNICGNYKSVNHELLLVGSTDKYWKLKNSYGLQWGERGYLYLDKSKGENCLNVCMDFSYPTGLVKELDN